MLIQINQAQYTEWQAVHDGFQRPNSDGITTRLNTATHCMMALKVYLTSTYMI